jgi:hypothetical protein
VLKKAPVKVPMQKIGKSLLKHKQKVLKQMARKKAQQKKDKSIANLQPGSLSFTGCSLFATFCHCHIEGQQRSKDKSHNAMVQKLSKGEDIEVDDVLKLKPLKASDVDHFPQHWKFAPMLFATNAERLSASRQKAQLWALEHSTYVFKWRCQTRQWINKPGGDLLESVKENNAFFWQLFVEGAPGYLNYSINSDAALVNGSPITLHSFTFQDPKTMDQIYRFIEENNVPFGSEIEIPTPIAVNVAFVETLDEKPLTKRRSQQLAALKVLSDSYNIAKDSNKIILPLTDLKWNDWDTFYAHTGDPVSPLAKVCVREIFPFDLGFAMTVHKAQGRTIKRVIIDLRKHPVKPLEYASIFVAMSRVEHGDHIRLLEPENSEFSRCRLYEYISGVKPDSDIAPFLNGFASFGSKWDWKRALTQPKKLGA